MWRPRSRRTWSGEAPTSSWPSSQISPEIRAFDFDNFHVHNAFRAPGRLELQEFGKSKVEMYRGRYESFRKDVQRGGWIEVESADGLVSVNLDAVVFVKLDTGEHRVGFSGL